MVRTARTLTLAFAALGLALFGAGRVAAQTVVVSPPGVSYYAPAPVVTYYSPPVVYAPAPAVSYYYGSVSYYAPAPAVSYYTPSVSYYAPAVSYYAAPAAVTTTRYGVFGRPRVSTTYYSPVYVGR
jgi:hypothetical protein